MKGPQKKRDSVSDCAKIHSWLQAKDLALRVNGKRSGSLVGGNGEKSYSYISSGVDTSRRVNHVTVLPLQSKYY